MSNHASDLWQISIVTDTQQSILITINKNESLASLFKSFRKKYPGSQRGRRLTFITADGPELKEDDQRSLVEVGCLRDRCNIRLIVHADGGGWPTEAEIVQQVRNPTKVPSLAGRLTNSVEDIMILDDETPRVKMSCGHAIAPSSLARHCYHELENGEHMIQCPDEGCKTMWPLTDVIDAACLTPTETNEFELKMISNRLKNQSSLIRECPGCGNFCHRSNEKKTRIRCPTCSSEKAEDFYFCWLCTRKWENMSKAVWCGNPGCGDHTSLFVCLAKCETKPLNGVDCPSRRACPSCLTLIEHTQKCKHMKCPNKRCKYEFCFICLQHFPCQTGAKEPCPLAPRQSPTTTLTPTSHQDCAIL